MERMSFLFLFGVTYAGSLGWLFSFWECLKVSDLGCLDLFFLPLAEDSMCICSIKECDKARQPQIHIYFNEITKSVEEEWAGRSVIYTGSTHTNDEIINTTV